MQEKNGKWKETVTYENEKNGQGKLKKSARRILKKVTEKNKELKKFLNKNMYSHRKVLRMEFKADLTLEGIFNAYIKMPELLPESVLKNQFHGPLERRICDYVSGMTDRYALNEHKKLYSSNEEG